MVKRRDPIAINSVGIYMQKQSDELKNKKEILMMHINNILNNYKGIDAETIVSKFLEEASKLDSITKNLDYYAKYMQSISSFDTDNLNTAKKDLGIINNQPIDSLRNTNFENLILSNEVIGGEQNE